MSNDFSRKLLGEEKSPLLIPDMARAATAPVCEKKHVHREFCRSWQPKQVLLHRSRNSSLSFDVNVPVRDIINKISFFNAPFSSIYGSEYSKEKVNAMSQKIMEMGFSTDEALAGIVTTDATGVTEAVNAIWDLQPIPSLHNYIAKDCYTGDAKPRHFLLNRYSSKGTGRWPWNVSDERLCALCGLPKELFHKGDYIPYNIFGETWSKMRMSRERVHAAGLGGSYVESNENEVISIISCREPDDLIVFEQKVKDTISCGICWEETPRENFIIAPCGHNFCNDCLKQHYRTKIMQGDVLRVPCPHVDDNNFPCDREVEEMEILLFCDEEMKAKFLKFKESRLIQLNDKARFCPKAGCDGWALGSKWKPKLTCPDCEYVYCWKCTNDWHGYFSRCVNPHDGLFILFRLGKDIQTCPKCKVRIWKSDGCNHMTCRYCKYEFCWLCRGKYSDVHFEPWNLMGCPGGLYFSWVRCPSCCPSYINRFCIILFLLTVALPLALTGGTLFCAFCITMVCIWLALWIVTCIPGICMTRKYITPCGCRDYWC